MGARNVQRWGRISELGSERGRAGLEEVGEKVVYAGVMKLWG